MPPKPAWFSNLDTIIHELRALPRSFVDRATIEFLLGIGRRRAQQIMAPCIVDRVGSNGLADRDQLIERLQRLADGDEAQYERQRRQRVVKAIAEMRRAVLEHPRVLVEAPDAVVNQAIAELPSGVHLTPGQIRIEFRQPSEALEKLLALAMAIGNDMDRFECLTRR